MKNNLQRTRTAHVAVTQQRDSIHMATGEQNKDHAINKRKIYKEHLSLFSHLTSPEIKIKHKCGCKRQKLNYLRANRLKQTNVINNNIKEQI